MVQTNLQRNLPLIRSMQFGLGLALIAALFGLSPAPINAQTETVVVSLAVFDCDATGCTSPVEGFSMRYRTDPNNDIRLVTANNGYAESDFSYQPGSSVLIVPEFVDFERDATVGERDISCESSGVELPMRAVDSESANQMFALDTAEAGDIGCKILLNTDRVGTGEAVEQLPNTGSGNPHESHHLMTFLLFSLVILLISQIMIAPRKRSGPR